MKPMRLISKLFAGFGAICVAIAILVGISTARFVWRAARADGEVVSLEPRRSNSSTTYAPVVRFRTDSGQAAQFQSSVASSPPAFSPGEHVEVLYDPNDLGDARINTFGQMWGVPAFLGIFGGVFGGIGLAIILSGRWRVREQEVLRATGKLIVADYQEVALNTGLTVNGRNPFQVIVQWRDPDSGQVYLFRSPDLWYNPEKYITSKTFNVYVKPGDLSKYYVDISPLPKLADGA